MKISWIVAVPVIVLSAGATAFFWSTRASMGVVGALLLIWWIAYTYGDSPMDRVYNEYLHFDDEMRREFMEKASPQMRAEIEARLGAGKEPPSETTRGK